MHDQVGSCVLTETVALAACKQLAYLQERQQRPSKHPCIFSSKFSFDTLFMYTMLTNVATAMILLVAGR